MTTKSADHARTKTLGVALLLTLTLPMTSCGDGQSSSPNDKSQLLQELERDTYAETAPPASLPTFRWDFANEDVHSYVYEQEARIKGDMGAAVPDGSIKAEQSMSAKGTLLVKSQGDGTAELVLRDMKMSVKMDLGEEEEARTMEQVMPPIVVQGMKEDGSGSFGDSPQDMFLKMLFPLPSRALRVGDSVDVPAQMPFNAMGSVLQVTGRSRITLTRYVNIGKRTCAQLDVDIDISDLKVPPELKGEYEYSTKGSSVLYFDVGNRTFVSGTTAVLMQFSIDAPAPKTEMPGEDVTDMPERLQMSMMSDILIRLKLKD